MNDLSVKNNKIDVTRSDEFKVLSIPTRDSSLICSIATINSIISCGNLVDRASIGPRMSSFYSKRLNLFPTES